MKVIQLNLADGLGVVSAAVPNALEADRVTRYMEGAAIALSESQALSEQGIEKVYQRLARDGHWESCTTEAYRLNNEWGNKTRVLFTRPEAALASAEETK